MGIALTCCSDSRNPISSPEEGRAITTESSAVEEFDKYAFKKHLSGLESLSEGQMSINSFSYVPLEKVSAAKENELDSNIDKHESTMEACLLRN